MTTHPIDHRAFLASLSGETRADLTAKSDLIGLSHLALHWGCIGLVGALIAHRVPGWWALMPLQGVLLVFLFTLLHETSHQTAFKSRRVNKLVGYVCGFLLLLPANWFRYYHFAHHRHTQDPDKDPELAHPKPQTEQAYAWHITGLPVWISQITTLVRNASGGCRDTFVPNPKRGTVQREALTRLGLYAAFHGLGLGLAGIGATLWTVWICPMILGQPFLRLYLLAEHGRCPLVANMFENSRTTFTNWLVRKLAWNMPYHAEHHAAPTVPFHRLPDLHKLARPHLCKTSQGYTRFHQYYAAELAK